MSASRRTRVGLVVVVRTQPTIKERIVELLRSTTTPLDDDEIADRLGVRPRQTINKMCRELESQGELERIHEVGFKIVNRLRRDPRGPA
jgi:Mn-dependent DtxR family transcriptional regulator